MKPFRIWFAITLVVTVVTLCSGLLASGYAQEPITLTGSNGPVLPFVHDASGRDIGRELSLWFTLPFVGILLSIALFPLFAPHFWHLHYPKIAALWALFLALPFLFIYRDLAWREILQVYLVDYIPFIILLWALFVISGGILVRGALRGTPLVNTMTLAIGSVAASVIGTTGASILFIRPLLRSNGYRKRKVHTVVFFIFLVSNIGGLLTPLGDPPLFLGFLHGVPFFWTLTQLANIWLFAVLFLLILYYVLDRYHYAQEEHTLVPVTEEERLTIAGIHNLLYLGGVIGAVLFSGLVKLGEVRILGIEQTIENLIRDGILILMGILSLVTTAKHIRVANEFTWGPIKEVAYLFAGIFVTVIPPLAILKAGKAGALASLTDAVTEPAHYFWMTGLLSGFLDNAPTYLAFFNTALGSFFAGLPADEAVRRLIAEKGVYLEAIATGAVFMGANSYIGNAPNFMVKSIAEEAGIRMPTFLGYMAKYSLPILIPFFMGITMIFFS